MAFDPRNHGFIKIDHMFQGVVQLYELEVAGVDHSSYDMMRLNNYLSQDDDFVNVWFGLIDAHMAEVSLEFANDPTFRFSEQYEEPLFRGYIPDDHAGGIILDALRLHQRAPNILTVSEEGKLECRLLAES